MRCRLVTDSTMTTTETCFKVAVSDTAATTALSDVRECDGKKGRRRRRKRSIDDAPATQEFDLGDIVPSRSTLAAAGISDVEADLQSAGTLSIP